MKKIILKIEGMTCSACSSSLEKYLLKQKGIDDALVNLVIYIYVTYDTFTCNSIFAYDKSSNKLFSMFVYI